MHVMSARERQGKPEPVDGVRTGLAAMMSAEPASDPVVEEGPSVSASVPADAPVTDAVEASAIALAMAGDPLEPDAEVTPEAPDAEEASEALDAEEASEAPAVGTTGGEPDGDGADPAMAAGDTAPTPTRVTVEFAGEYFPIEPGGRFLVGREGDLAIDDNLFLHRHFLEIAEIGGLWWLANIGSRLQATVTDASGGVQAWLAPGARLPLVFAVTSVIFSAGPTTYEFTVHSTQPTFRGTHRDDEVTGESTIGDVPLTLSQKQLLLALAEPLLRRDGTGMSAIPSSTEAAARLGWAVTRFNRKLDNVCEKFDRIGVPGMRGGARGSAVNRRARLVEHVIASRLVDRADLVLLDTVDAGGPDAD
jgi:hypothetical protein